MLCVRKVSTYLYYLYSEHKLTICSTVTETDIICVCLQVFASILGDFGLKIKTERTHISLCFTQQLSSSLIDIFCAPFICIQFHYF